VVTTEKPSHIKFSLRSFTDAEIEELVTGHTNFRRLNHSVRDGILEAMRNGWWQPGNGETIAISDTGKLLNGQHRLSAAQIYQRETNTKVWFWVANGVKPNTSQTMDTGETRKIIQYLANEGVLHAKFIQAIALGDTRLSMTPKALGLLSVASSCLTKKVGNKHQHTVRPSIAMTIDRWRRNRGAMQDWAKIGDDLDRAKLPRASLLAAFGYQFAKKDSKNAKMFFEQLINGTNLTDKDPVYILRQRLLSDKMSHNKMQRNTVAAILVKAWVAWNEGREVTTLRWISTGPTGEPFPSHEYTPVT